MNLKKYDKILFLKLWIQKTSDPVFFLKFLSVIFFVFLFFSYTWAWEVIDWKCWVINWKTIENFPVNSDEEYKLCEKWEFDNWKRTDIDSSNPYKVQHFVRECKWIAGWTNAYCSATWTIHYYDNSIATQCWLANWASFMTTASLLWIAYTNFKNEFLWNLCIKKTSDWELLNVWPVSFNQTSLGRTWQCPTLTWRVECFANLYQHANCWEAANKAWTYTPDSQLCAPWTIASIITFDPDTYIWKRTCEGNWWANPAFCQAWMAKDLIDLQPSCNPLAVNKPDSVFDSKYITSFLWNQACSVWDLDYWSVNDDWQWSYIAQRKCSIDDLKTPTCDKVLFPNYDAIKWYECNDIFVNITWDFNWQAPIFDSEYELFAVGLCKGWWVPSYFQKTSDWRKRTCWPQTCEAKRSLQSDYCGWAKNLAWKNYPTQWLCKTWLVASMMDVQQTWYFWQWECYPQYQPDDKVVCKAPRIVDWKCKRTTQINTRWFMTPQDVLESWLCEDWIPYPLVPEQDFTGWKWRRKCSWLNWWKDSDYCYAKVYLPKLDAIFDPEKPSTWTVAWPVIVNLTGFNPLYINFIQPLWQWFKLFEKNTWFTFKYRDWAWNEQETFVLVDWIDESLPSAKVVFDPEWPTTWNVNITLTWFTSDTIKDIYFTWSCILKWTCSMNSDKYDIKHTVVTFSWNWEGGFVIIDDKWENFIPVVVTWIDRQAPIANLYYSTTDPTNQNVVVEVINPSEKIKILNNWTWFDNTWDIIYWNPKYVFTGNWTFVFEISDLAWNISYLTATVDRIDKTLPTATVVYSTTWITTDDVVATLTNFNKSWIVVLNNSWSFSYTFTYNKEFTFLIKDKVWNINHITAKVTRIDKPILPELIKEYTSNICSRFKKRLPIDIQWNEFNMQIITVIRNCLMKWYTMPNNHTYFYPRQPITRWEFITILWRFIKLVSEYEGKPQDILLSDKFINVVATWTFWPEISEADALWLLFYVPLIQSWTQKYINVNWKVSAKEAKFMLKHTLELLWQSTKPLDFLIDNDWYLTRWDVAYIFANLIYNYKWVIIGNNLEFLKVLYNYTKWFTPQEMRRFVLRLLKKLKQIDDETMIRVWLDPKQLESDLIAIAQRSLPKKQRKVYIRIKSIMDEYLRWYDDPFNNEVFNDNQVYTDKMFEQDEQYDK